MDRGTYVAATGGMLQMRKLEVQNNNLANINTVGFKRQFLTAQNQQFSNTFADALGNKAPFARGDHDRSPGVENVELHTDFSPGAVSFTSNPLDVALRNPKDFFVINTPDGPQYTRAGNFTLSANSELVTPDGMQVMGDGGPLQIVGGKPAINADGSVTVNGQIIARLQIAQVDDTKNLVQAGANRFKVAAGRPAPTQVEPQVIPKSLEMSNVSAVTGMVDLIVTSRAFEAYTKAAQTIDGMNQTATTTLGRKQ
jgi:flagellar basal-body rod protein FlgF